jgi:signal transduction histidine kinase
VPGTGLGLTIVKHVAEEHSGSVEVRSEPGKGSTFSILLPLD